MSPPFVGSIAMYFLTFVSENSPKKIVHENIKIFKNIL
jgi:hypothetical protein